MNEIKVKAHNKIYRLTNRNNGNKYDRAVKDAGPNASVEKILAHYDKHAGYIQDESGNKVENGQFWEQEKKQAQNDLDTVAQKSDEELESIIRRAENTNVPGSLFQRAKLELELRDRKRNQHTEAKPRWWEKTWVQIIMVLGAIAGIVGLVFLIW